MKEHIFQTELLQVSAAFRKSLDKRAKATTVNQNNQGPEACLYCVLSRREVPRVLWLMRATMRCFSERISLLISFVTQLL